MPHLSDIANYASILGLLISLCVLYNIWQLKSKFSLFVRIPSIIDDLEGQTKKLKNYSRRFETSLPSIRAELSRIEANLDALVRKDKRAKSSVDRVTLAIQTYKQTPNDREKFLEIHSQLLFLIETAKNIQEDRKLER